MQPNEPEPVLKGYRFRAKNQLTSNKKNRLKASLSKSQLIICISYTSMQVKIKHEAQAQHAKYRVRQ